MPDENCGHSTPWLLRDLKQIRSRFLHEPAQLNRALAFRRAIELNPMDMRSHFNLGNTFRKQGQLEEAIAEYRITTELAPAFPSGHYNLGYSLAELTRWEQAINAFRATLAVDPMHERARQSLLEAINRRDNR